MNVHGIEHSVCQITTSEMTCVSAALKFAYSVQVR